MDTNNPLHAAIRSAIDELNLTLPPEKRLSPAHNAPLLEPAGPLDSLGLVNLVVEAEQRIEETCGVAVNLTDLQPDATDLNPFATVDSLVEFAQGRLRAATEG
jgi:acyl carrier protein